MPRPSPITIGNMSFRSRAAAKERAREILSRLSKGDIVPPKDTPFVEGLLERHPNRLAKIGDGVQQFEVGSGKFNEKCFVVRRVDGTVVAFSYKKAVDQGPEF